MHVCQAQQSGTGVRVPLSISARSFKPAAWRRRITAGARRSPMGYNLSMSIPMIMQMTPAARTSRWLQGTRWKHGEMVAQND